MKAEEFFYIAADLTAEQQTALFHRLSEDLTAEEIAAVKMGIGYFRLIKDKAFHDAMQTTLARQLYAEFTGRKDHERI